MTRQRCRIAGDELVDLFSLGNLYVSNFVHRSEQSDTLQRGDLSLAISKKSGLVQLTESVDLDTMYRRYWYNSGTNLSMKKELENIVSTCTRHVSINDGDYWLDIGCNDGTLLSYVPAHMVKVGIDPSNSILRAESHADMTINDYFSKDAVKGLKKFKVITAIAMFYDLDYPLSFLNDIHDSLEDDGLFVVQMSYLPLMLIQLAFDNICHEHITYFSLEVLKPLFEAAGLTIRDCEINDTNGGSFRVFAQKSSSNVGSFNTAPYRDVANFRIDSILTHESTLSLKDEKTYQAFFERLLSLKKDVVELVDGLKSMQKRVWGYGASTKGNTLLQFFGLDHTKIDAIAERQSIKYGMRTAGTDIPIFSEREMRERSPDYLLMLPWHFVYEFTKREQDFLNGGGKFIVPCPKLEVIGA